MVSQRRRECVKSEFARRSEIVSFAPLLCLMPLPRECLTLADGALTIHAVADRPGYFPGDTVCAHVTLVAGCAGVDVQRVRALASSSCAAHCHTLATPCASMPPRPGRAERCLSAHRPACLSRDTRAWTPAGWRFLRLGGQQMQMVVTQRCVWLRAARLPVRRARSKRRRCYFWWSPTLSRAGLSE
jgi:hypothetical protein